MNVTFSVVIPCHNDGKYLDRSVRSVCNQTLRPLEVVVVDDGSTDNSADVAEQLTSETALSVRVVRQANGGVSSARNTGISQSQGEFLVFLDADDELQPDALQAFANAIAIDTRWLIGNCSWERNGEVRLRQIELPATRDARFVSFIDKSLHLGNISNCCFARNVFDEIRFDPNLRFGEDTVVFSLLLTLTDPVVVPVEVAQAHRRGDSLRTRASLDDLIASNVPQAIFSHPMLDPRYQRYANRYLARHYKSIVKRAWRDQNFHQFVIWYRRMVSLQPLQALNPKLLWRFMRARKTA